ncbi:MAG TPA: hypothetical protein VGR96_13390 [Acidobacteriaceae bacterium]|nr:hypothetical protein [Acidobacteriaceae bacterium]
MRNVLLPAETEFRDEDLRTALNRALRTVLLGALAGAPLIWWAWQWPSMLLYLVGAAIAATGILEWRQLMAAVLVRLDSGKAPRPFGPVLFWFFLRLAGAGVLLYVSLKSLDGRISALIAGLALAMLALLIEAIRLLRSWSA